MDIEDAIEMTNATSTCNRSDDVALWPFECISSPLRVFHGVCMFFILVAAVAGNGTLLALVGSNRKLQTSTIMASMGLVVADLLVTFVWVFQSLASTIAGDWPFGTAFCSVFAYLYITLLYVRWSEVFAFTMDRALHIIFPFFYNRHSKILVTIFTLLAWILPAAVTLPTVVMGYSSFILTLTTCSVDCGTNAACRNGLVLTFGFFITVGGIMPTAVYFTIFLYGRKKKREMDRMLRMGSISGQKMAGPQTKTTWFGIVPQARKALISCFIVFLITLFTNIPVYITSSLRTQREIYGQIPFLVHYIVVYIFLAGPILDPIIIMRNKDFWEVIYKIHRRRKARLFKGRATNILALSIISPDFLKANGKSDKPLSSAEKYILKIDSKSSECESPADTEFTDV